MTKFVTINGKDELFDTYLVQLAFEVGTQKNVLKGVRATTHREVLLEVYKMLQEIDVEEKEDDSPLPF